ARAEGEGDRGTAVVAGGGVADGAGLGQGVSAGLDVTLDAAVAVDRRRADGSEIEVGCDGRAAVVVDDCLHQLQVRGLVVVGDRAGPAFARCDGARAVAGERRHVAGRTGTLGHVVAPG